MRYRAALAASPSPPHSPLLPLQVGSFCSPLVVESCRRLLQTSLAAYWVIAGFCSITGLVFLFIPSPQNPHRQRKQQQGAAAADGAAAGEAAADGAAAGEAAVDGAAAGGDGSDTAHSPFQGRNLWFAIVPVFVLIWTCVGTEVSATALRLYRCCWGLPRGTLPVQAAPDPGHRCIAAGQLRRLDHNVCDTAAGDAGGCGCAAQCAVLGQLHRRCGTPCVLGRSPMHG